MKKIANNKVPSKGSILIVLKKTCTRKRALENELNSQ